MAQHHVLMGHHLHINGNKAGQAIPTPPRKPSPKTTIPASFFAPTSPVDPGLAHLETMALSGLRVGVESAALLPAQLSPATKRALGSVTATLGMLTMMLNPTNPLHETLGFGLYQWGMSQVEQ